MTETREKEDKEAMIEKDTEKCLRIKRIMQKSEFAEFLR